MSKNAKHSIRSESGIIEIKSKFDAEFRRFSVDHGRQKRFEDFQDTVERIHFLRDIPFTINYTDIHGDLLPINNDDNFHLALSTAKPALRIMIQRKGESYGELNGYGTMQKKKKTLSKMLSSDTNTVPRPRLPIGLPEDFRRVSAIIDVDIVPEQHRRVKLMKNGSDKPLGFYIRDGTSVRITPQGLDKVPGIYISRLVPGGLAESTGLLAVNDEVLEVNGIEVTGKTLDQVTDMMVANSSNLIITVKPVNQRMTLAPQRGGYGRYSQMSSASHLSSASGHSASGHSRQSSKSYDSDMIAEHDDEDEVQDHLSKTDRSDRAEKSRLTDRGAEKADKLRNVEKLNRSDLSNNSGRSNGSGGHNASKSSNGSGRGKQDSGSGGLKQQDSSGSGRLKQQEASGGARQKTTNNDSGRLKQQNNGSGRQKHEEGDAKGDGPIVTL